MKTLLLLLATLTQPQPDFKGTVNVPLWLPVTGANDDTDFICLPENTSWAAMQKWKSKDCIILFTPTEPGLYSFVVIQYDTKSKSVITVDIARPGPSPPPGPGPGPEPPPGPGPGPEPPPGPDYRPTYPTLFALAGKAKSLPASQDMSTAFSSTSATIAGLQSKYSDWKEIQKLVQQNTLAALKSVSNADYDKWFDWNVELDAEMRKLSILTASDYVNAYKDVAAGMK